MSSKPILIVGAGLGGVSLARALGRKGIPYRIFERDALHSIRQQGWAISLHPWLMTDICSAISDDEAGLRALAPTAPLGLRSEGIIYSLDQGSRQPLFKFGEDYEQSFVRVERAKFRDWLLQGVTVEWGKRLASYEERADGVVAHFEDGTEVEGRALVGADGVSSRGMLVCGLEMDYNKPWHCILYNTMTDSLFGAVRNQLLQQSRDEPQRLGLGIIVGEVEAHPEQYRKWLKLAASFSVGFADSCRLFIGLKSVAEDQSKAQFYWMCCW